MELGVYVVTGRRAYRGHEPGTEFWGRLDRNAEGRAIMRGDIRLVQRIEPKLPERFTLPEGWLSSPQSANQERELH